MWASGGTHPKARRTGQRSLESHPLERPGILLEHDITIWPQPSFIAILKPSRLHPGSTQCSPVLSVPALTLHLFPSGSTLSQSPQRLQREPSSTQQSVGAAASSVLPPITMSCGGCGCCPKCGCRATCTCNRNIFSLENQADFSGMSSAVADENDGHLGTTQSEASRSGYTVAGENGDEGVNCGWHAPGSCA